MLSLNNKITLTCHVRHFSRSLFALKLTLENVEKDINKKKIIRNVSFATVEVTLSLPKATRTWPFTELLV